MTTPRPGVRSTRRIRPARSALVRAPTVRRRNSSTQSPTPTSTADSMSPRSISPVLMQRCSACAQPMALATHPSLGRRSMRYLSTPFATAVDANSTPSQCAVELVGAIAVSAHRTGLLWRAQPARDAFRWPHQWRHLLHVCRCLQLGHGESFRSRLNFSLHPSILCELSRLWNHLGRNKQYVRWTVHCRHWEKEEAIGIGI
jgi:hypothetical protein